MPTPCHILVTFHYYDNDPYAPKSGILRNQYDDRRSSADLKPLEFPTVAAAFHYLAVERFLNYYGSAEFSPNWRYELDHGEHARPDYRIVSAKSHRTTKAILEECDRLSAEKII